MIQQMLLVPIIIILIGFGMMGSKNETVQVIGGFIAFFGAMLLIGNIFC